MKNRIGVAIIGLGRMGLLHFKNCLGSTRADVQWIARNNVKEAKRLVTEYNLPTKYTSPDNIDHILEDSSVDAVVISSPTDTHEDFIRKSLNAGKDVFCEKPISPSIEATTHCYDLAQKVNKTLLCAFQRRFDPSLNILKEKLERKVLNNPRLIKISSHDVMSSPTEYQEISGGILNDSTIHDFDVSLWLANSKPTSIFIQKATFDPNLVKGDCDLVVATIQFDNGLICVIDNGRQATFGYDQRTEVLCDKGSLKVTNRSVDSLNMFTAGQAVIPNIDQCFTTRYNDAYRLEMEHFFDVIQGKSELKIKKADVLAVHKLIQAGFRSMKEKTIVSL